VPYEPRRSLIRGSPFAAGLLITIVLAGLWPGETRAQAPPPPIPPGVLAPLTPPAQRVLPREQPEIVPPAPPPGPVGPPPSGEPVRVDRIRIEGVTIYDTAGLQAANADAIGPAVPRARLDAIVQELQARYRDEGYILTLVRGEFIRSGAEVVFVVRAIEGYISDVKLDGDIGAAGVLVLELLDHLLERRPVNNADLERYLLLANDVPGVRARAVLRREGAEPGAVALVAQVSRREFSGLLNYDNRGPKEAGPHEILLSGASNSFTRFGERFEALFFNTFNQEQFFGQVNADGFIGSDGVKGHLYVGRGNTQPGGALTGVGYNGDLTIGGGAVSYPVVRSRRFNMFWDTGLDTYQSRITLAPGGGVPPSRQDSRLLIWRAGGYADVQDALFFEFPAATALTFHGSQGLAGISQTRPLNRVDFSKVGGDLTRVQDLLTIDTVRTALKLSVGGQYSDHILPPSEKYFLGGTRFGRGFFNGEVTGDRAIGSTVELQANTAFTDVPFAPADYRLPAQFYGFWDFGRGYNLGAAEPSHTVQSLGIGVRSDVTPWLFTELEGVHRLTTHPQGKSAATEASYAFFARVTMHY
jgi:hemolysin activation/secretion protein